MNHIINNKTALLLVDIQNDYFPNGLYPLVNAEEALSNAKVLLNFFRKMELLVIHVKHESQNKDSKFFIPNTTGCEIHQDLTPTESEKIVIKHRPNSFMNTNLHEILKMNMIDNLIICGMMSQHCIDTTVRAGSEFYNIFLIHDACATRDLIFQGEVIKAEIVQKTFMAALQGFSTVISTSELINERI